MASATSTTAPVRLHPALRYLLTLAAALTGAAALAGALAVVVFHGVMASSSASDPWAELGAFLLALAVGLVVGVVGYLVAVTVALRRQHPPGRRLRPVAIAIIGPVAAAIVVSFGQYALVADPGGPVLSLAATAGLLVASTVGIAAAGTGAGHLPRWSRHLGLQGLGVAVVALVAAAVIDAL
jgi:hypothetical protein